MVNLAGKRVLITRPRKQIKRFSNLIISSGAVPICMPVIEISPLEDFSKLDKALNNLDSYDWFVLTSVNGVSAVLERLRALDILNLPKSLKIACIGPKTAAALEAEGISPNFIPEEYIADAILPGLGDLTGLRVLLTRADIARSDLPEAIEAGGGTADDICAYRTIPAALDAGSILEISKGIDIITFTSPSTAQNFFKLIKNNGLDPLNIPNDPIIACIGPITARTAQNLGYEVALIPEEYTVEGLHSALLNYYQESVNEH